MKVIRGGSSPGGGVGGGGGKPAWNIYVGLDTPPVKTNGLWIELDASIDNMDVVIDFKRPSIPKNNTLFISYWASDFYPHIRPVVGFDGVRYQAVSVQLYTTANGWENVDAYHESNGQWRQFSQRAWFIYTATGTTLFKRDRNGTVIWQHLFAGLAGYSITHITCDWKNKRVFAVLTGSGGYIAVKINMDGTEPAVGAGYSMTLPTIAGRTEALFAPDGNRLIFAAGSAPSSANYILNINTETLALTPVHGATNNGAASMYMLPTGMGVGISATSLTNAQPVRVYPTWAILSAIIGQPYIVILPTSESEFVAFNHSVGAQSYYKGNVSSGFTATATTPGGRDAIRCAANLINGDVAFGVTGFVDFVTVSGNTLGSIYKSIAIPGSPIQIKTDPDGTLFVTTMTGIVYRIDTNDAVTQVASTNATTSSAAFNVEPANIVTNPELYPNPRSWLYNNGVGGENFELWYTSDAASARFTKESNHLLAYTNRNVTVTSGTIEPIEVTNLRTISMTVTANPAEFGTAAVGISKTKISSNVFDKSSGGIGGITNQRIQIDVSNLTGEYYIGFYLQGFGTATGRLYIYEVSYE